MKQFRSYIASKARSLLMLLIWLLLWQGAYLYLHQDLLLVSPWQVILRLLELVQYASFWITTFSSLYRIAMGFLLAIICGTVIGILTTVNHWLYSFFYPAISTIRATPVSSFIILALIWMSSNRVVIFIVFLMVMPIVWANVAEGIKKTDPNLIEMAHLFRLSRWRQLRWIYLPSISPYFVSAATTGLGLGWKAGIAAEVLSTPAMSLGKSLYESKIYLETLDLFTYTIVVILMSLFLEKIFIKTIKLAEKHFNYLNKRPIRHSHRILVPIRHRHHTFHHTNRPKDGNP